MAFYTSLANANKEIDRLRDQLMSEADAWEKDAEKAALRIGKLRLALTHIEGMSHDRDSIDRARRALDEDEAESRA